MNQAVTVIFNVIRNAVPIDAFALKPIPNMPLAVMARGASGSQR